MDFETIIGWIFNPRENTWKKPDAEDATWTDSGGNKRTAAITRGIGVGPDGVAREYDSMCGLPDPDVYYPKRHRDVYDAMANEGPNEASWYRGLHSKAFWE